MSAKENSRENSERIMAIQALIKEKETHISGCDINMTARLHEVDRLGHELGEAKRNLDTA